MGKRGRPRKIKTLEQYTVSELRSMPMGSMIKLFMSDLVGKKAVVASPSTKHKEPVKVEERNPDTQPRPSEPDVKVKQEKHETPTANPFVAEMVGMPLDKKADYLADALMGYLKKSR